jgi:hypothetical protein
VKCKSSPEGSLPEPVIPENPVSPIPTNGTTAPTPRNESTQSHLCKRCNALFHPRSSWQLYCTGKCRTAACRAANKDGESDALVRIRVRQQANEIERAQTDARVALRQQTKAERDAVRRAKTLNHQAFLATARELKRKNKGLTATLAQDITTGDTQILAQYTTRAEDTFDAGVLGVAIATTDRQNAK